MKVGGRIAAAFLLFLLGGSAPAAIQAPSKPEKTPARKSESRGDPLAPLLTQAEQAINNKQYDAAVAPLRSYLAQRPADAVAHAQLGYVYSELQRWEEAKTEYKKAIELNPKLAEAHLNLGVALIENEPAAAVEPLRRAAELLPNQYRPRFLLGVALERTGKPAEAIEEYQAAARLDGKEFGIHFSLGRALLAIGRAAEAEAEFHQALGLRSDFAPARLGLANSLLLEKKLEQAAVEFDAYLQLQPQDRESREQRASILVDLGRYREALQELDRSDAGGPSLASARLRADIYIHAKQWPQAAEALERALHIAPQDAELHARLGRIRLEQREFAPAERELRQALQIDSNRADALRDLAAVLYLQGNYPATLETLERLERRETLTAGSWFVRATCYDKLARKREAVGAYQKFLELDRGGSDKQDFQARQRIRILMRELQEKRK